MTTAKQRKRTRVPGLPSPLTQAGPPPPAVVRVGYMDVPVYSVPQGTLPNDDGGTSHGQYLDGEIKVEDALRGGRLANTVLHEVLHAVWDERGLDQDALAEDPGRLEEVVVNAMANGLSALIRDNPDLVPWLARELAR